MTILANGVSPATSTVPLPDKEARDYALERLRDYICSLVFRRTNAPGQPSIPFQLPPTSVLIQQPDAMKDLPLPGVGIVPGRGFENSYGLGPPELVDATVGIGGPQTALLRIGEYTEQVTIEVWGSKVAERRALMAGLKAALRAGDSSAAIFLHLPDYWGIRASFLLDESQYIDGDEVLRNRRRAHLFVTMTVPQVVLTNARELQPAVSMTVLDGNGQLTLDCEPRED